MTEDQFSSLTELDPDTLPSQQPYGKRTLFCQTHGYVEPTSFGGESDLCPYHQRSAVDEDGATYRMYDEFNDEGEEW